MLTALDGLGTERRQACDGLGRLKTFMEAVPPDRVHSRRARPPGITDPAGLVTTYCPNAYGDTLQRMSSDSGTTILTLEAEA